MDERSLSFWYYNENHIETYKKTVVNYLDNMHEKFKEIGTPQILLDFHNGQRNIPENINGHLFVYDLEDKNDKFKDVCEYVLSEDRAYIPVCVSCSEKKDYSMIENILRQNYGEKGKLVGGFFSNLKKIKGRSLVKSF